MDKISIIVPCYNEEKVLPLFYQEICKIFAGMPQVQGEFLFIDDGSRDHTLDILQSLVAQDTRCRFLSFSRNFGKEAAMYAGLQNAQGDYCVIMDADLQHPPALLPEMYRVVRDEGYDCCAGFRQDREGEGKMRNFLSRAFYRLMDRICNLEMRDGAGDFRMMSRTMVQAILQCQEYNRYMKGLFSFVGFDTKWIPFHNTPRVAGETKWNLRSLFRYALEGIFSFSTAPITLVGVIGLVLVAAAFLFGMGLMVRGLIWAGTVNGLAVVVDVLLLLSGLQFIFLSIVGQYITKDYMENKNRPVYIVKRSGGTVKQNHA